MLERRSALAAHPRHADVVRFAAADGTLVAALSERRPLAIAQVSAFAPTVDEAAARLAGALPVASPAPNRYTGDDRLRAGAIGPGIWQVVGAPDHVPAATALRAALSGVATVVDLSHARTALRLSGPIAARALAQHCPLDLDPAAFAPGSVTSTRFDHLGITLARIGPADPVFELLVFRGYAEFVFEALLEGLAEFGAVVPGQPPT